MGQGAEVSLAFPCPSQRLSARKGDPPLCAGWGVLGLSALPSGAWIPTRVCTMAWSFPLVSTAAQPGALAQGLWGPLYFVLWKMACTLEDEPVSSFPEG